MAYEVIDLLGGELWGALDRTVLNEATDWYASSSYSGPTQQVGDMLSDKWLHLPNGYLNRPTRLDVDNNGHREIEFSFALYMNAMSSPSGSAWVGVTDESQIFDLRLYIGDGPDDDPNRHYIHASILGSTYYGNLPEYPANYPTPVELVQGGLYWVTLRVRGQSGDEVEDGRAQVWINGVRYLDVPNLLIHRHDPGFGMLTTKTIEPYLYNVPSSTAYVRNIALFDGWTTGDDEAPPFLHVADELPLSLVSATGWTAEGGAADVLTALTDADDATYARADTDGAELIVETGAHPDIGTLPLFGVAARIEASREDGGAAEYRAQVQNDAGSPQAARLFPLSAVLPAVQRDRLFTSAVNGMNADALRLALIRGS